MSQTVNIKPYRVALEALIAHQPPSKLSAMLGNAAANLDDPELRNVLMTYIERLDDEIKYHGREPIRILGNYKFAKSKETVDYVNNIIDSQQYGYGNTWGEQLTDLSSEMGEKVVTISPTLAIEIPGIEPLWVVAGSQSNPENRSIILYLGQKTVTESAGPAIFDCPLWMFELAPTVKNASWRKDCIKYWEKYQGEMPDYGRTLTDA